MSHGQLFTEMTCCRHNDDIKNFIVQKKRNVRSFNSEEIYFKCRFCGQEFMEKVQNFICPHNDKKQSYDKSYTLYIKKYKPFKLRR
jgi:Zn finger protein HypA/HybF involved in hydrogenase expression